MKPSQDIMALILVVLLFFSRLVSMNIFVPPFVPLSTFQNLINNQFIENFFLNFGDYSTITTVNAKSFSF